MANTQKVVKNLPFDEKPIRLKTGSRLGKYRLAKRIGKGGYCEIFKARDTLEGIWVALKIPHAGVDGKRDNQSVLREVRLVAQLRHPHIMPIKNAEIINGHAVLATELSTGTLADLSKPMGVKRLLSIITQVLDGLSYAHSKRMVHCDVTPSNIFLFPNGRAALGDFGIGFQVKGRAKTIDEFGTPGYVAPEQAYGRPTYRSDCFAVALILYEYLTGYLPRWPFYWPFRKVEVLRDRAGADFVRFIKKALDIDPAKRFPNARQMHDALKQVMPARMRKALAIEVVDTRKLDWQQARREAFIKRYRKVFPILHPCVDCGEPIAEPMTVCPWCGSDRNRFDDCTIMPYVCTECHRGLAAQWKYCPWCYRAGFEPDDQALVNGLRYHGRCKHCNGKLMRFMRYCPWCHRKVRRKWQVWPFPELCNKCGWSVDSEFWNYCPWCEHLLV